MKIISFSVNNFRSINGGLKPNTIKFEDSNTIFIFGQNNVGKSTFLRAYEFFVKDTKPNLSDFFNQDYKNKIEFEIIIKIEEKDSTEAKTSPISNLPSFLDKKNENNLIWVRKVHKKGGEQGIYQTHSKNFDKDEWEDGQSIGIGTIFGSILPKPIFIKAMPSEEDVKKTINEILKIKAEKNLKSEEQEELKSAQLTIKNLQNKMYGLKSIKKYEDDVNKEFEKLFPDISFEIKDTDKLKMTHDKVGLEFDISCKNKKNQFESTNIPESLTSHGHGTVRTAIFMFLMLQDSINSENEKDIIILFEEPELFLHPKLTRQLRSLMYNISKDATPYQVLCASHSPQMIDISKDHTSIVRMVKDQTDKTQLYQVDKTNLHFEKDGTQLDKAQTFAQFKEFLRFNPFICEAFYADEVVLVEGDTEAIIWRGYLQEFGDNGKDIFVVNCGGPTNMPFYQKIFSKFNIRYSVICDTDHIQIDSKTKEIKSDNINSWDKNCENPKFKSHIQRSIQIQFESDQSEGKAEHFFVFDETFEPVHKILKQPFTFDSTGNEGKPYNANRYWEDVLLPNKGHLDFNNVPIIKYIRNILEIK